MTIGKCDVDDNFQFIGKSKILLQTKDLLLQIVFC